MSLLLTFIKRPIATTLLGFGIAFAGMIAYGLLPVSPLPQIEFPTISVQASLPGASPEIMATSVATPLERQLGHISGITEMTSSSSLGATSITIQFDLSRNINGAARDVQAAIIDARSQLPSDLPSNPTYRIVNPSDSPILILALTSPIFSAGEMYDIASTVLQQKISQIDGVGQVLVGGSSLPAVRVDINPTSLNKYGLSLEDVRTTLKNANANLPKGQINPGNLSYEISATDQLFKANNYKPLLISYKNGAAVTLSDVADVKDSVEDLKNAGLFNGKPAVLLVIFKRPGSNIIDTVDSIKNSLEYLKLAIPSHVDISVAMDRTLTIRSSLHEVKLSLILAIFLVIFVIYRFLGNIRAALIPSIAVPLSLLGTFGVMYLLGYSLDNLSLMALTIATGFVVDDAVVVVENISRHIEAGMDAIQAAIQGTKEVCFTVISMSLSLIAVFIPILLMNGIVGRLFREFSITLSISILVSMVISLTVTPMMASQLLKHIPNGFQNICRRTKIKGRKCMNNTCATVDSEVRRTGILKDEGYKKESSSRNLVQTMKDGYAKSLKWALDHSHLVLMATFFTILLNVVLFIVVPKGFFPQQDTGRIVSTIQAQQNISFSLLQQKLHDFIEIIKDDDAVNCVTGFIGGNSSSSGNSGRVFISLKDLEARKISVDDVINRLRKKLSVVAGATLYMRAAQDLVIGGRQNNGQYQYTLSSYDLNSLNTWTPRILEKLSKEAGIVDVNNDQLNHGLEVFIHIDRDTASRLGVTTHTIDNTLYDAFGQRQVSTMYTAMNQYHVVMGVAPKFWQKPDTLKQLYVKSVTGQQIPLSAISNFSPGSALLVVNHQGQLPAATISFNLMPGFSLGDAVDKVNNAIKQIQLPTSSIQGSFQGTAQAFQRSLESEPYLILAAIFAVYIVLGMLYESTIHPLTILSTLPSAGVGALFALILTGGELNVISLIGILLLIGIVKKNAIMIIDFALHIQRTENKSSEEAVYEASILRFRPIMMTTMAALLSAVPLAFGTGVGYELRKPLGISIIGGLIVSQVMTLYTIPVIYLAFERFGQWLKQSLPFSSKTPA
ncbi:MAG: efflux RND transporter permease subunit [Alphaproteobacteria bacterium]|nr:efflux RND transporter permease subunit [Alphaproteobacteria bacterium]